jgi:hypothetical protein
MTKKAATERLTEPITLLVTTSQRARLQQFANERTDGTYSLPVRWAIQAWLDANAPMTPEQITQLVADWTASKTEGSK